MKTKSILTCFLTSILIAGFAFYPFVVGNPQSTQAFNTDVIPGGKTKQVTLITNETVVQVAPDNALHPGGVAYNAYTFNGTIPGPTIGIDQGDNLTVTLTNEGKLIHSYDFHAGLGPKKALSGSVQPGETKTSWLQGVNAGSWLYHCGADGLNGVWEHIANGMYGTIVVHPQNEEPAKEFSVVFSEIYNNADPGVFNEVNGTGSFDIGKFLNQNPDLMLTNGMSFKYAPSVGTVSKLDLNPNATVFTVKPGELTRWYITNPGPNDGVAFHFISGQLDVRDGFNAATNSYGVVNMNDETWWIPPGSSSVIETVFPDEGVYVAVDHNMADVVKGAAFAVLATENATATDHPEGSWVPPQGSEFSGGSQQAQWVSSTESGGGTNSTDTQIG
ncbi:MAG: multicopper oxidase domain-containing protein [Nitrososphaeraceae archaeon]|nr:multicopper oxidase domain-containing protein [Nitrososphaeraceae archaeon]